MSPLCTAAVCSCVQAVVAHSSCTLFYPSVKIYQNSVLQTVGSSPGLALDYGACTGCTFCTQPGCKAMSLQLKVHSSRALCEVHWQITIPGRVQSIAEKHCGADRQTRLVAALVFNVHDLFPSSLASAGLSAGVNSHRQDV